MYNSFMAIGKVNDIYSNGSIEIGVKNDSRDIDGSYGTTYVKVVLCDYMLDMIKEQLQVGRTICVKGHITSAGSGFSTSGNIMLLADKIWFII